MLTLVSLAASSLESEAFSAPTNRPYLPFLIVLLQFIVQHM